jgi:flagellar hook-length control protein FliK
VRSPDTAPTAAAQGTDTVDPDSSERRFMTIVPRGSLPIRSPFGEPAADAPANERGLPPGGLPDPRSSPQLADPSVAGDAPGRERQPGLVPESAGGPSFGQLLQLAAQHGVQANAPAGFTPSTPAAVQLNLPTPVNSPEFQESLGVQVSVLARDGVQHAELHLNPAEMGPISVRIALDGNQAQVNFGADSATTRALIEAGLPELATALRESGLTLSGGGVSHHARDGQGSDAANSRPGDPNGRQPGSNQQGRGPQGGAGESDPLAAAPTARRVRVANGVDLYA